MLKFQKNNQFVLVGYESDVSLYFPTNTRRCIALRSGAVVIALGFKEMLEAIIVHDKFYDKTDDSFESIPACANTLSLTSDVETKISATKKRRFLTCLSITQRGDTVNVSRDAIDNILYALGEWGEDFFWKTISNEVFQ